VDIFFTKYKDYLIDNTPTNVRDDINRLGNKELGYFSNNLIGTFNNDNTFKLTNKWTLGVIRRFERVSA
jgi:hypothetical protein